MRSIFRLAAAGALSLPILIGAAGMASADPDAGYVEHTVGAGPMGAYAETTESGSDGENAYWHNEIAYAGPWGAGASSSTSWSGDGHHHDDGDGDGHHGVEAGYVEHEAHAGPWGAYGHFVGSFAETD